MIKCVSKNILVLGKSTLISILVSFILFRIQLCLKHDESNKYVYSIGVFLNDSNLPIKQAVQQIHLLGPCYILPMMPPWLASKQQTAMLAKHW